MSDCWVFQRRSHSFVRYKHGGYSAIYPERLLNPQHDKFVPKNRLSHAPLHNNIISINRSASSIAKPHSS